MPYRRGPAAADCRHCGAATARACMRCAHPVCETCEETHDAAFPHRDYGG